MLITSSHKLTKKQANNWNNQFAGSVKLKATISNGGCFFKNSMLSFKGKTKPKQLLIWLIKGQSPTQVDLNLLPLLSLLLSSPYTRRILVYSSFFKQSLALNSLPASGQVSTHQIIGQQRGTVSNQVKIMPKYAGSVWTHEEILERLLLNYQTAKKHFAKQLQFSA